MLYGNKIYPLQDKIMAALNGEGALDCLALTLFSSNLFQGILIQLGQGVQFNVNELMVVYQPITKNEHAQNYCFLPLCLGLALNGMHLDK